MLNRDVLARNPSLNIPNDGVAKVGRPANDNEWEVLRYELQSFVCAGEYERGLDRVLDAYLGNLDQATQPAAWVSGFYGSGKSHFVRVLDALWSDLAFPDGARARGLVQNLPDAISAHLKELSTRGLQSGGLWAASGEPHKGTSSPRLGLLDLLFNAAGLPQG